MSFSESEGYKKTRVQTEKHMHKDHVMTIDKISKMLKISRETFYRYISLSGV